MMVSGINEIETHPELGNDLINQIQFLFNSSMGPQH